MPRGQGREGGALFCKCFYVTLFTTTLILCGGQTAPYRCLCPIFGPVTMLCPTAKQTADVITVRAGCTVLRSTILHFEVYVENTVPRLQTRPSRKLRMTAITNCRNVFIFLVFLGPHSRHMEVPRLGVKSELQLLAYATATATPDPSLVCDLHHSSRQCWILSPQPHGS